MSGGPKTAKPTEKEVALSEIASQQWSQYQETGIPLENEYIRRVTGMSLNDDGEYEVDPNGRLNADGTTKTDTTAAQLAAQDAFGDALNKADPNRQSVLDGISRDQARTGAQAGTEMGLGQQTNTMKGMVNVAGMGQGREAEALQSHAEMAQTANNNSIASAQRSFDRRSANSYVAGQALGAAGAVYGSKLDKATANRKQQVGRDHHPGT